ncbi:hypothetical protein MCO_00867 [Bartonella sp. DB5-6]|uniref:DUF6990 domain-containing protein n=1 Tax=Bartonella sp. DB5-6 TaxID=1094755 RepID=UPI00026E9A2A|nr:hypothetical protein [Bartonella sp. DB5-6]EJF77729.1 hypothetical protein MCO_00867 [Bartonella sp. DB5-6]
MAPYQLSNREVQIHYSDKITKSCPQFYVGVSLLVLAFFAAACEVVKMNDAHYDLFHIATLALLSDAETLQFYNQSFAMEDHLGFDNSIQKDSS